MSNYVFIQDEDSHWYRIPVGKKKKFEEMCEKAYSSSDFDDFIEEFEGYMIGCHPSNFDTLYNEDGTPK